MSGSQKCLTRFSGQTVFICGWLDSFPPKWFQHNVCVQVTHTACLNKLIRIKPFVVHSRGYENQRAKAIKLKLLESVTPVHVYNCSRRFKKSEKDSLLHNACFLFLQGRKQTKKWGDPCQRCVWWPCKQKHTVKHFCRENGCVLVPALLNSCTSVQRAIIPWHFLKQYLLICSHTPSPYREWEREKRETQT